MEAANACVQAGLIPSGPLPFWQGSQWTEVLLMSFTIDWRPEGRRHSPEVVRLGCEALDAMQAGKWSSAQELLEKALKLSPGAPDLHYNLARVLEQRGRSQEAFRMLEEIRLAHPDYIRATVSLAMEDIRTGRLEHATELLGKVMERTRMHVQEFGLLCEAELRLARARGNAGAVESWREMWLRLEAQEPDAVDYRPPLMREPRQPIFAKVKAAFSR